MVNPSSPQSSKAKVMATIRPTPCKAWTWVPEICAQKWDESASNQSVMIGFQV